MAFIESRPDLQLQGKAKTKIAHALASHSDRDGRQSATSAVSELIKSGLLSVKLSTDPVCAQDGKPGYIYFLDCPSIGLIKIGSTKKPKQRLKTLKASLGPNIKYLNILPTEDMGALERAMHSHFSEFRSYGEFFQITANQIEELES